MATDRPRRRWLAQLLVEPSDQRNVAPVLFLTIGALLANPFMADSHLGRAATTALVGLSAIIALRRTGAHTAVVRAATTIVVCTTIVAIGVPPVIGSVADRDASILTTGLFALLLVVTPMVMILRLLLRPRITLDTVAGTLAAYLQIALFFGALYRFVDLLSTNAFFSGGSVDNVFEYTYFSFITITTVGYGDLTPATTVGQTLASVEAILGQLFLVTVVALVVTNLGQEIPRHLRVGSARAAEPGDGGGGGAAPEEGDAPGEDDAPGT